MTSQLNARMNRQLQEEYGVSLADYEVLVVLTDAVVLTAEASKVSIHVHDLALFAGLLICSAATVELTRRVGENLGLVKDVYAVWELPVAMLLPLAYVPVLPAVRFALTQWRIQRAPVYRRVFSAAASATCGWCRRCSSCAPAATPPGTAWSAWHPAATG
jgi:hypothetical protein